MEFMATETFRPLSTGTDVWQAIFRATQVFVVTFPTTRTVASPGRFGIQADSRSIMDEKCNEFAFKPKNSTQNQTRLGVALPFLQCRSAFSAPALCSGRMQYAPTPVLPSELAQGRSLV
jgi:hypothetical protein